MQSLGPNAVGFLHLTEPYCWPAILSCAPILPASFTEPAMNYPFLPSLLRRSSGEPPLSHRQVFAQPSAHPPNPVLSSIYAPVSPSDWGRLVDGAHLTHLWASRVQHWPGPGWTPMNVCGINARQMLIRQSQGRREPLATKMAAEWQDWPAPWHPHRSRVKPQPQFQWPNVGTWDAMSFPSRLGPMPSQIASVGLSHRVCRCQSGKTAMSGKMACRYSLFLLLASLYRQILGGNEHRYYICSKENTSKSNF